MTTPTPRGNSRRGVVGPGQIDEPRELWNQVLRAREEVAQQRHLPASASGTDARMELLSALEAYVASLMSRGRPIPYALRDELRLQRLTCPAARQARYVPMTGRPLQ